MGKKGKKPAGGATREEGRKSSRASISTVPDERVVANDSNDKINDGKPHIVRTVELNQQMYRAGQEDELAAAEGFAEARERLTAKGAIVGFDEIEAPKAS